jgi:hypothetical protein
MKLKLWIIFIIIGLILSYFNANAHEPEPWKHIGDEGLTNMVGTVHCGAIEVAERDMDGDHSIDKCTAFSIVQKHPLYHVIEYELEIKEIVRADANKNTTSWFVWGCSCKPLKSDS